MEDQQKPKSIERIFPKDLYSSEIKNETNEIKKSKNQNNRDDLVYESSKYVYDFNILRTVRYFGNSSFSGKITICETDKKKSNLLNITSNFNDKVSPRSKADKERKSNIHDSKIAFYEDQKLTLNAFKCIIFPLKLTQGKWRLSDRALLELLTLNQMLWRLLVAFTQ